MNAKCKRIIRACGALFGIRRSVILSNRRSETEVRCRHAVVFLMRHLGMTFLEIATVLNKEGHSTSMASWRTGRALWDTDPRWRAQVLEAARAAGLPFPPAGGQPANVNPGSK